MKLVTNRALLDTEDYTSILDEIIYRQLEVGEYSVSGLDLTPEEIHADVLALQQDLNDRFDRLLQFFPNRSA